MKIIANALLKEGFGTYEVDLKTGKGNRLSNQKAPLLVPGFVDVHIHGGNGVDFMHANARDMEKWIRFLSDCGYEAFLPTTVTASASDVIRALQVLPEHPMVKGFHLEGPFINPKFPGAQPKESIVLPPTGPSEWDGVLDDPRLRYITMAPELPGAIELASRLSRRGVVVSLGHTDATFEQARAGYEAGFRSATHTYNAMRPLHHREAGTVGFALLEDGLTCELIYDRHHVKKEPAGLLVKNKPSDRLIAVSDGTMAAGVPAGQEIRMWNLDCVVKDGQVRLKDGTLAGSAITLLDAFRNLAEDFGLEVAIRACSLNPRILLGMSGSPTCWIVMDEDLKIQDIHRLP